MKRLYSLAVTGGLAAMLSVAPAAAKDRARIDGRLTDTGAVAGASGRIKAVLSAGTSRVQVRVDGLQPFTAHTLRVGGIPEATFNTSASGRATLRFQASGSSAAALPLDFDPRGEEIGVDASGVPVLEMVFSGGGEPAGTIVDERTGLAPTAAAPGGKAEARFRQRSDGRRTFKVEIEDVPAGGYDLYVGGVLRASIVVAAGEGEVEFDSAASPPKLPLDFDPRGAVVDVQQGSTAFFSGLMAAQAPGVNSCTPTESEEAIASTGVDPDGSAKARVRTKDDCERDFQVEAEDVPVGDYEVWVGGTLRGTLTVVDTGLKVEGELEFDTDPDDPGEVLLDFDPAGATVEIRQGAVTFFSGAFTGSGGGGGGSCTAEENEVPLLNTGVDGGAKGKARYRLESDCDDDFRVEVEDLPLGDYTLRVGGVVQGTLTVALVAGEAEGELEFDNDPDQPGELPLTFDPRGQLIEIEQGGTVFLERIFP